MLDGPFTRRFIWCCSHNIIINVSPGSSQWLIKMLQSPQKEQDVLVGRVQWSLLFSYLGYLFIFSFSFSPLSQLVSFEEKIIFGFKWILSQSLSNVRQANFPNMWIFQSFFQILKVPYCSKIRFLVFFKLFIKQVLEPKKYRESIRKRNTHSLYSENLPLNKPAWLPYSCDVTNIKPCPPRTAMVAGNTGRADRWLMSAQACWSWPIRADWGFYFGGQGLKRQWVQTESEYRRCWTEWGK